MSVDERATLAALLDLSRQLALARREEDLAEAVARALEVLFPGRTYCIRFFEPRTLALTTLRAKGQLRSQVRERVALRRIAIEKTGLSLAALERAGLETVAEDAPVFDGSRHATAVPLAAAGSLFGVLNLEYPLEAEGTPRADEPLLIQVANQAAVAVKNQRSLEELTYLKTYLEDLLEHANALIVVVNAQREVMVWNGALSRLTGFPRDEALGEDVLNLLPEEARDRAAQVLARGLDGEPVTSFETPLSRKGGGEALVAVNTAPIYGASGEVEGVIAIGHDLSALRALERRAEQAQKLAEFGRLAAGIVHELNNPLTCITVYSDMLLSRLVSADHDPGDLEKLRAIQDAGERLHRFSKDLLAYARPSADKLEDLRLSDVLDRAARMCEPALRRAAARIERRFADVPPLRGNAGSLAQVFVNLITNAADALEGREGGTVTLSLAPRADGIEAAVADDGPGMAPEVKARVFEPFFSTKADGKGSGLGLSIVQGIVARHGGAIAVESEVGKGTVVKVMLPLGPGLPS